MLLLLQLTSAFLLLLSAEAGRIAGGREAKPHSRPYMASISTECNEHHCGGFLIRPDVVLSAAHCLDGKENAKISVKLGAHNITKKERSQQVLPVLNWIIHPKYSNMTYQNDIVLLKLKKKARLTREVGVVSLASQNEPVAIGTTCLAAGWGRTSKSGPPSNVLMEVDLKVHRENICKGAFTKNFSHQSMICAGDEKRKKATLPGDSGGPLVCNGKVHGIASQGFKNGIFPKVFTNVSYFEPWIHEELRRFVLHDLPDSPYSQ